MHYVNFSVKSLKFVPKWPLSYFQPVLATTLVSIATIKVELIPDFYTSAIVRYKTNKKELMKSNFYILVSKRAKIHVAP